MKTTSARKSNIFLFLSVILVSLCLFNDIHNVDTSRNLFIVCVDASSPSATVLSSVQVSLKGKKYEINDVSTVEELQERLEEASGINPTKQGRILFQGKTLAGNKDGKTLLVDAGVKDGDILTAAGSTGSSSSSKKKKKKPSTLATTKPTSATPGLSADKLSEEVSKLTGGKNPEDMSPDEIKAALQQAGVDTEKLDQLNEQMKSMLESSGVDPNKMEDMVKNMMGGGGAGAGGAASSLFGEGAPSMEESMNMMSGMMNSPMFQQLMNDPEKLEESRQMILKNPMMKSMMEMNPQMAQILNDPVAWRESMQAAAQMYQEMDKDELLAAMKEGAAAAAGGNGQLPGLFGDGAGAANGSTTPSALDELDEDD